MSGIKNRTIFTGDNLAILRGFKDNICSLIYLDPPFNSKHNYAAPIGSKAAGAEFKDTWTLQDVDVAWWGEIADTNMALYKALEACRYTAGKSAMSYLIYMSIRILEMRRVLKETGSIYLHCDPTMSHYLKMVMDAIFGTENFRNEIVWRRHTSIHGSFQHKPKQWGRMTDTLLYYAKTPKAPISPYMILTEEDRRIKFNLVDEHGKRYYDDSAHIWNSPGMGVRPNLCYKWRGFENPHPTGWRLSKERLEEEYQKGSIVILPNGRLQRRKYESEFRGTPLGNLWTDVPPVFGGEEKLGYPTQKPLALLERIIHASSSEGDWVIDPFCGCATACSAAEKLGRKWIGIDISPKAYDLLSVRLKREAGLDKFTKGAGILVHRTDIPIRKGQRSPDIKDKLYGIQHGCCNLCRNWFEYHHLEVDHVIPKAKGGLDDDKNLQLLCGHCNRVKGDRTMEEAMVRLKELGIIIQPPTATTR